MFRRAVAARGRRKRGRPARTVAPYLPQRESAKGKGSPPARTRRTFRIFGCGNVHKTVPKAARFTKRAALLPKSYPEKTAFSTDFYNIFTEREKFMTSLSTLCKTLWITSAAAAAPFKTPLPTPLKRGRRGSLPRQKRLGEGVAAAEGAVADKLGHGKIERADDFQLPRFELSLRHFGGQKAVP